MKTRTKGITARAGHCPHPRMRLKALTLFIAAVFGCAGTMRGAGQYVKVRLSGLDRPGRTEIAVTYTLWIPDGVKTLRGIIVHQHGAGMTASKEGSTAAYDLHWQALAKKWDCALLGPSYHVLERRGPRRPQARNTGSTRAAARTRPSSRPSANSRPRPGIPNWRPFPGRSGAIPAGAGWADVMSTLHPERVIAVYYRSGSAACGAPDPPSSHRSPFPPQSMRSPGCAAPA